MFILDLRTLVAANAVVWVFSSLLLAVLWRSRKTYPGFGLWTIHAGLVTVGFAVFGARGLIPEWLSILGGNGLFGIGILFAVAGLRRFLGAPAPWRWGVPLLAAELAALAWFTFMSPSLAARIVVICLYGGWMTGLIARDALSVAASDYRSSARVLGSVMAGVTAVFAYRVVATTAWAAPSDVFDADPTQVTFFVAVLCVGLGGTIGIILLSFQRLEGDLVKARDQLQHAVDDITAHRAQIKVLEGLLPICAWCKKIRDEDGRWTKMEVYIRDHSQAEFSHGICPDCMSQHFRRVPGDPGDPAGDPR